MIRRIVKLTFQETKIGEFQQIFEESKALIRDFPGCQHLELWQAKSPLHMVFMTYSHWEDEAALERYRHSSLFKETWAKTKILFAAKPEAWSLELTNTSNPK